MRTPAKLTRPKPKPAVPASFEAPTAGWIASANLAAPIPKGAAALENWFPTATTVRLRGGSELYATLGDGSLPVTALWTYLNGDQEELFGATDNTIYNITVVASPTNFIFGDGLGDTIGDGLGDEIGIESTGDLDVFDYTGSGNWIVVQFATSGGIFLIGVNGDSEGFIYDGTYYYPSGSTGVTELSFDAPVAPFTPGAMLTGGTSGAVAEVYRVVGSVLQLINVAGAFVDNENITDTSGGDATVNGAPIVIIPAITGASSADFSFVWIYKQRAWFVKEGSLDAYYLPTESIGGPASVFPLGGVFGRGGSLLFGATWSLDSGAEGGLSEQCVFVSTEGEVAVYQGTDPTDAATWSKVGVYRIGRPLGPNAFIRAGGDLIIATDIGFIPLSQAIQRDVAALSPVAVSYNIEVAWNERVADRSAVGWHCELWPTKQMSVITLPTVPDTSPEMLVANARTGAWALYTGWNGTCFRVFKERGFFGSTEGRVVEAEVTGSDEGRPYTGLCLPLFSDLGSSGVMKTAGQARAILLSPYSVNDRITMQLDFTIKIPPAPDAALVGGGSVWGLGVWGQSVWGQGETKKALQNWRSVAGTGYAMTPAVQITSGSVPAPAVDLVRIDVLTQVGDIGT